MSEASMLRQLSSFLLVTTVVGSELAELSAAAEGNSLFDYARRFGLDTDSISPACAESCPGVISMAAAATEALGTDNLTALTPDELTNMMDLFLKLLCSFKETYACIANSCEPQLFSLLPSDSLDCFCEDCPEARCMMADTMVRMFQGQEELDNFTAMCPQVAALECLSSHESCMGSYGEFMLSGMNASLVSEMKSFCISNGYNTSYACTGETDFDTVESVDGAVESVDGAASWTAPVVFLVFGFTL